MTKVKPWVNHTWFNIFTKKEKKTAGSAFYWFEFRFSEPKTERDDLINPYWIEDKDLKRGEVDYLSGPEIQFWKDLLAKYLYPIDENKEQQVRQ